MPVGRPGIGRLVVALPRRFSRMSRSSCGSTSPRLHILYLGAPFWYNQLRLISSLRPVVAHKEQQEREQTARNDIP